MGSTRSWSTRGRSRAVTLQREYAEHRKISLDVSFGHLATASASALALFWVKSNAVLHVDDDDVYPRETPPHIRTARASPQRPTAAGTAAPTTADTGNTVPQRANPTQTAYAHPRRRAQAQGQALRAREWAAHVHGRRGSTRGIIHRRCMCIYRVHPKPNSADVPFATAELGNGQHMFMVDAGSPEA